MAHQPKPFFRTARNAWYVQLGKQQLRLADGPRTTATEKAAWDAFYAVMAARAATPVPNGDSGPAGRTPTGPSVAAVVDKFLDWTQKHRAAATYDWYLKHAQDFLDALPDARMAAADLKPFHVTEWADGHAKWGDTYRRGAIVGVQRVFNWAVQQGYVDRNPVVGVEKPRARRREQAVTPAEFETIVAAYAPGDPFRALLTFSWETGCRPQEAKRLEARHVDPAGLVAVFPVDEAKGKQKVRRILDFRRNSRFVR